MAQEPSYTVIFRQDGRYYVALCLELNVASQGRSLEEARQNIGDAIHEYLSCMEEDGLLDEIKPVPFNILREFLTEGRRDVWPVSS
jgi:predicted RNase H-like HicB family nuclease